METKKFTIEVPENAGGTTSQIFHGLTNPNSAHSLLIRIEQDTDAGNPLEENDAEGKIFSLGHRHRNYDPDAVKEAVENNPDHVKLSYYEHGQCRWSVQGDTIPGEEFRWDGAQFAGVWVPDKDVLENIDYPGTDPAPAARRARILEYAKGVCEGFTQWCNGDVYGYIVELYTLAEDEDGEPIEEPDYYQRHATAINEDSCWGFFGWEYAQQEARNVAEGMLEGLKPEPEPEEPGHPFDLHAVTKEQREALGWALDLAYDDQENYLKTGDPAADYGDEWPEVRKQKAAYCRGLADLCVYSGEVERWQDLAKRFEEDDDE